VKRGWSGVAVVRRRRCRICSFLEMSFVFETDELSTVVAAEIISQSIINGA
jgi:hypothetical protein